MRAQMKKLYIVFAFACGVVICKQSAAQVKGAGRAAGGVFRDCGTCPEMVPIPAGTFTMGSSAEEKAWAASHGGSMGAVSDEAPQHQVSLA